METARPASTERTKPRRRKKRPSSASRPAPSSSARSAVGRRYPSSGKQPGYEPPVHFRMNLSEIPFVTGKVKR